MLRPRPGLLFVVATGRQGLAVLYCFFGGVRVLVGWWEGDRRFCEEVQGILVTKLAVELVVGPEVAI
jgi:hypothetical protein